MEFERDRRRRGGDDDRAPGGIQGPGSSPIPPRPNREDKQQASPPPGGYAHEWDWQRDLEAPVHVDHVDGIAWVRVSECPVEEREALSLWIEEGMMTCPVIDGIEPQDAVYVWNYAAFRQAFLNGELT